MTEKRKLQVFVSSTFTDLIEERQAAVQAILTAGHIPAGMELFSAGDQSQMDEIRRWIDESDVFLLILGGRYGTVENSSQKSYTHLEYEYALKQGKALFAVVADQQALEERIKNSKLGLKLMEQENQHKLKEFQNVVCSNKIVKFWSDSKDIELAILKTLSEFSRREELIGWIPGNQAVNAGEVAKELARLAKENSELREQVSNLSFQLANNQAIFNGLTYEEMYQSLNELKLNFDSCDPPIGEKAQEILQQISIAFGDSEVSFLHCFWSMRNFFGKPYIQHNLYGLFSQNITEFGLYRLFLYDITQFGLCTFEKGNYIKLTECGQRFLSRLINDKNNNLAANKCSFKC